MFAGTQVVHMAPPAKRVSGLMSDLFKWLKQAKDHLLIRSCVFHYEFEFIHPFTDGNGRMGRLWQSLLLGQLHPVFQYLPVENMVYANQQGYYQAINQSTKKVDSGIFVDFMLEEILLTLKRHLDTSDVGVRVGATVGVKILEYVRLHPGCRANVIAEAVGTTTRTVERHIRQLREQGQIEFRGAPKTGGYYTCIET